MRPCPAAAHYDLSHSASRAHRQRAADGVGRRRHRRGSRRRVRRRPSARRSPGAARAKAPGCWTSWSPSTPSPTTPRRNDHAAMTEHVEPADGAAPDHLGPGWDRLLAAARRRLERTGGDLRAKIGLTDPTDAERHVVIGLTGRHRPPGTVRLTLALDELDAGLRRARGEGLLALLTRVGGPVRDRPAERAAEAAARDAALAAVGSARHGAEPWYLAWRAELAADGTITRLIRREEEQLLGRAVTVLDRIPADGLPLPVLAETIAGDPKALSGRHVGPTRAAGGRTARGSRLPPTAPSSAGCCGTRSGVVVDDLASQVLVLNLPAEGAWLGSLAQRRGRAGGAVAGHAAAADRDPGRVRWRPTSSSARTPRCCAPAAPARTRAARPWSAPRASHRWRAGDCWPQRSRRAPGCTGATTSTGPGCGSPPRPCTGSARGRGG